MRQSQKAQSTDWLALIDAERRAIFSKIERALDVAPAQRYRFEGLLAAAQADGVPLEQLQQFCLRDAPPHCAVQIDAEHRTLRFDCWQQRAPVY